MHFDQPNLIVKNIFTDDEITQIYKHIDNTPEDRKEVVDVFSQQAYHSWLPQNIVETLTKAAQSTTQTPLVLRELSFAKYAKFDGAPKIQLTPHTDRTFREPRMTFDIQIKSNRTWALVVEGRSYTLNNNEALTFSGTHQVHWRESVDFLEGDYMDMIFAHFSAADYIENELGDYDPFGPPTADHDILMEAKQQHWTKIYNESK